MIHLPQHVRLVCLSATVSNVDELADWITTVRGPTASIVERRRPVRLDNEYLVADRTNDRLRMLPVFVDGHVNRDAVQLDESAVRGRYGSWTGSPSIRPRWRPGIGAQGPRPAGTGRDRRAPRAAQAAAGDLLHLQPRRSATPPRRRASTPGSDLTSRRRTSRDPRIIDARLGGTRRRRPRGARLRPVRRPARVRDRRAPRRHGPADEGGRRGLLRRGSGEGGVRHRDARGRHQHAGAHRRHREAHQVHRRASRAADAGSSTPSSPDGPDGAASTTSGTAVVLWSPWVRFDEVAELAGSSSFHLRSAFRPTYNMAANLIRTYSSDEAHHLLNLSFAQYQADRDVVRLEARLERRRLAAASTPGGSRRATFGDIDEYRRLREQEQALDRSRSGRTPPLRSTRRSPTCGRAP